MQKYVYTLLVLLFSFPLVVGAAIEEVFLDITTNQPTYTIEHDGTGFDIFPIPTGFTCSVPKTTFCSAGIDIDVGWNVMRAFVSPNDATTTLVAGDYGMVNELGSSCSVGESFADCSNRATNVSFEFTVCDDLTLTVGICGAGNGTSTTATTTITFNFAQTTFYGIVLFAMAAFYIIYVFK